MMPILSLSKPSPFIQFLNQTEADKVMFDLEMELAKAFTVFVQVLRFRVIDPLIAHDTIRK